MIAADFLRDPTGIRIGHALPNGPTAGSCGPFLFGCNSTQAARHLHGSTKVAGEGRLWMMRCAPLISIVAQSVCMAVILPPEMAARSGEGRLWMMRCPPISIVAQSAPMATILLPEMRQSLIPILLTPSHIKMALSHSALFIKQ